jgi:predicted transcriptional regulator
LELLRRRPCSVDDISKGLGIHPNEVVKYVEQLSAEGLVASEVRNHGPYYKATRMDTSTK